MRRRRRRRLAWVRWRGVAHGVCVLLATAGLVVFVVGRVATDWAHWTQYLWWVPAGWCVVWVWGWLGVSRLVRKKRSGARRVGVVVAGTLTLFVVFGVWRVHRGVLGGSERGDIRIVHWNVSSSGVDIEAAGDGLGALDADVVCIANARWGGGRRGIADRVAAGEEGVTTLLLGQSVVVSRLKVLADASVYFGWSGEVDEGVRQYGHRGWVHMLALDAGGERPLVVWVVDLPSEPTRWRVETAREAVGALLAENVRARVRVEGAEITIEDLRRVDVMIGDFNTPRGSGSLGSFDRFARGGSFVGAFERAGWGVRGSWTTDHSNVFVDTMLSLGSWHIDLALVDRALRVTGYAFADVAETDHRAQVVDVSLD